MDLSSPEFEPRDCGWRDLGQVGEIPYAQTDRNSAKLDLQGCDFRHSRPNRLTIWYVAPYL